MSQLINWLWSMQDIWTMNSVEPLVAFKGFWTDGLNIGLLWENPFALLCNNWRRKEMLQKK